MSPDKAHGLKGHVSISNDLTSRTTWPLTDARAKSITSPARTRRPMGRLVGPLSEPMPALTFLLEGDAAHTEPQKPSTVVVAGQQFLPSELLLVHGGVLAVDNRSAGKLSFVDSDGKDLGSVAAGAQGQLTLRRGDHTVSVKEIPSMKLLCRVVENAVLLAWKDNGDIPLFDVPGGDYNLTVYLGATTLATKPVSISDTRVQDLQVSVSATGAVEMSVRDAFHFDNEGGAP
jgi:hypothetical protein